MHSSFRLAGLLSWALAVLLLAAACGGDSSLEDLGDDVQSTRVAQATIDAENATPVPTPTPEPPVDAELRALNLHAVDINSFFSFLQLRLATSQTAVIGGIGDGEGNLTDGWLDACCGIQWEGVNTAIDDANASLVSIQAFYEEGGAVEELAFIPAVQTQLNAVRGALDALATAATVNDADGLVLSSLNVSLQLDAAIAGLVACCGPAPTPTPSLTPTATAQE